MFGEDFFELRALVSHKRAGRKLLDTLRDFCVHDSHISSSSPVCLPATAVEVCAPLINVCCEKDTDDCRKILRIAHYLLRRVLSSPHGHNVPRDVLENIVITLKSRELSHKHVPRRMEALRTLACCLRCIREPETLVNELLLLVRSGLKECLTWTQRVASAKRRKAQTALHQELWLAQAYFATSAHILNSPVEQVLNASSPELMEYYTFGVCSKSPAVARNCASQLLTLAESRPDLVAIKLAPLLPQHKSGALLLSEEFVCVRMLDVFCCLASRNSKGSSNSGNSGNSGTRQQHSEKTGGVQVLQYCEAIAFVLATDQRWRVVLHAIRALASVSWSAIEHTQMSVDESGDVVGVSVQRLQSVNAGSPEDKMPGFNGGAGTSSNNLMCLALMDRVINQLSDGLVRGLKSLQSSGNGATNNFAAGVGSSFAPGKEMKAQQDPEGLSADQPSLFVHTVLRTIAAVGRCHAVHLVQSKFSQFVSVRSSRGTDALRTVLAPNLWKLAISSSDSTRLQSLLALVWLAPAPPTKNDATMKVGSSLNDPADLESGGERQSTLNDLELLLERTAPLPRELAHELLRQFRGRVALSPTLSRVLLRWHRFLVAANVGIGGIVSIWHTCLQLGDSARAALLASLFDITDSNQPHSSQWTSREQQSRAHLDHLRLRQAAFWMLGRYGVHLCGPSEKAWLEYTRSRSETMGGGQTLQGVNFKPVVSENSDLLDLNFGMVASPLRSSDNITASESDLENPAMRCILLVLLTSAQHDSWQSRRAAAMALVAIGIGSCTSITLRVVVRDILVRLLTVPLEEKWQTNKTACFELSLDDIVLPGLAQLDKMLSLERSQVSSGTWQPTEVAVEYPLRDRLEAKLAGTKNDAEKRIVMQTEQNEEVQEEEQKVQNGQQNGQQNRQQKEEEEMQEMRQEQARHQSDGRQRQPEQSEVLEEQGEQISRKSAHPGLNQDIWTISGKQSVKYSKHFKLLCETSANNPPQLAHMLPFFSASSLPHETVMKVWKLVNIEFESQPVTEEQFSVAFHIVTAIAVLGVEIPSVLSSDLTAVLTPISSNDSIVGIFEAVHDQPVEVTCLSESGGGNLQQSSDLLDFFSTGTVSSSSNTTSTTTSTTTTTTTTATNNDNYNYNVAGDTMEFFQGNTIQESRNQNRTEVLPPSPSPFTSHKAVPSSPSTNIFKSGSTAAEQTSFVDQFESAFSGQDAVDSLPASTTAFGSFDHDVATSTANDGFGTTASFDDSNMADHDQQSSFGTFESFGKEDTFATMETTTTVQQQPPLLLPQPSVEMSSATKVQKTTELSFEESMAIMMAPEEESNVSWIPSLGVELEWYTNLFFLADEDGDDMITGQEGVQFLMRSGRTRDELRTIWEITSKGSPSLTRSTFFQAMRLVQLAQHGYNIETRTLHDTRELTLPSLPQFQWIPTTEEAVHFDVLFGTVQCDGVVGGKQGVLFLLKSGRPKELLREIWQIVSAGSPSLTKDAFYQALRLVQLAQNDIPIDMTAVDRSTGLKSMQLPSFNYGTLTDQIEMLESIFYTVRSSDGIVSGSDAVTFLRKSQLSDSALRMVWEVSAKGFPTLEKIGFQHAMRLVAKLQMVNSKHVGNSVRDLLVSVTEEEYLPLPKF